VEPAPSKFDALPRMRGKLERPDNPEAERERGQLLRDGMGS